MSSHAEIAELRIQARKELPPHMVGDFLKFLDRIAAGFKEVGMSADAFGDALVATGAANARGRRSTSLYVSSPTDRSSALLRLSSPSSPRRPSRQAPSSPHHTRKSSGSNRRKTRSGNR